MKKLLFGLIILAGISVVAACGGDNDTGSPQTNDTTQTDIHEGQTVKDTASTNTRGYATLAEGIALQSVLSMFNQALKQTNHEKMLAGPGSFTVFAPNDRAFDALPDEDRQSLMMPGNKGELAALLAYHILEGRILIEDLADGQTVTTLQGEELKVRIEADETYLNDALVLHVFSDVSNGIIYEIDSVLQPGRD